ncbi:MAG: hypothetical protein ACPLYF_04290, partial [Fervidobacterium sp.]
TVRYNEWRNKRGIEIGAASYFLEVKRRNKKWILTLYDMFRADVLAKIKLKDIEDLRNLRKNKIASILEEEFNDSVNYLLEQVVAKIHENEKMFLKKEDIYRNQPYPISKFDEEIETKIDEEVKKILETDNQLEALKPYLDVLIVGEEKNKQAALVLLLGSKYKKNEYKQILVFKGTEGGGKTTLASTLVDFFKTKEVGRFTEHALEYSNLEDYEVLYIKELGFMDEEKQGVTPIKFLSCDDKGFIVEYTIKDEKGRFRTEQSHIPAITTVSTTTRLILDSQFERRAWLFNVDESEEQTTRVKKWKALMRRQKDEVKLGLRKVTDYEFCLEVVKRFISQVKPIDIVIPFPETLAETLTSKVLRTRGDIDKIFSFVELYALLNVKRLWKLKDGVYAVTPEVGIEALRLLEEPLANMLGGGDKRIGPLLKVMKELGLKESDEINKDIRETIAVKLSKSEETIRIYLNFLEKKGFLSSD